MKKDILCITKENLKQKKCMKANNRRLVVQELKLICKVLVCPSELVQPVQFSIVFSIAQAHGFFFSGY